MAPNFKILPNYSYADYCQWEGRWEIIDGIPFAMNTAFEVRHQEITTKLCCELRIAVKSNGFKHLIVSPYIDYVVAENTVVQPDALIYSGGTNDVYLDVTPHLVAEVISIHTAIKDRYAKYAIYEKAGVPYFLLINPETEMVQLFVLEDGEYLLKQEGHDFTFLFQFGDGCSAEINFNEIW
jgi:Uma2 family endonuclease